MISLNYLVKKGIFNIFADFFNLVVQHCSEPKYALEKGKVEEGKGGMKISFFLHDVMNLSNF